MADVSVRLQNFKEDINWQGSIIQLLEWINIHLQYLPELNRIDTKKWFTQEGYEGEYFRVNEGRVALQAMYQLENNNDFLEDMKQEAILYHNSGKKAKSSEQLKRAFFLMEYVGHASTDLEEIISACKQAAVIGIDAKEYTAAYYIALFPASRGFVNSRDAKELSVIEKIAYKEMAHERDYGKIGID